MKLKELFAKTQGSRQLRIAGQKEKAMCGRDFWGRYRNTEAWETEVRIQAKRPDRDTLASGLCLAERWLVSAARYYMAENELY